MLMVGSLAGSICEDINVSAAAAQQALVLIRLAFSSGNALFGVMHNLDTQRAGRRAVVICR